MEIGIFDTDQNSSISHKFNDFIKVSVPNWRNVPLNLNEFCTVRLATPRGNALLYLPTSRIQFCSVHKRFQVATSSPADLRNYFQWMCIDLLYYLHENAFSFISLNCLVLNKDGIASVNMQLLLTFKSKFKILSHKNRTDEDDPLLLWGLFWYLLDC